MGEPYFGGSIFSWYTYWYARTSLEKYMTSKVAVVPAYAVIHAIAGNLTTALMRCTMIIVSLCNLTYFQSL